MTYDQALKAGMVRYARSLGMGTPAAGEVERQALAVLRGGDNTNG